MPDNMEILGSMIGKMHAQDQDTRARIITAVKSVRNAPSEYIAVLADIMTDFGNLNQLTDRAQAFKTIEQIHNNLTSIEEEHQAAIDEAVAKATKKETEDRQVEDGPEDLTATGSSANYATA